MTVPQVVVPEMCPRCAPGGCAPGVLCAPGVPEMCPRCARDCAPGVHRQITELLGNLPMHTWGTPGAHLGHTWGLPGMMCPRCALCPTRCARDVHLGHTWGTKHTWGTHISGTTTISAINDRQNSVCYAFCVTSFHFFFQRFAERIS